MKIIKRIFISLILLLIVSFGGIVTYIYLNQDDIEQRVISEINLQLKSDILIEDVTISAIKSFPFVNIRFDNLTVFDAFQTDTLCQLEQLSVSFNAMDLYNENYTVQNLTMNNGKVTVLFKDGLANYEIWHSDTTSNQAGQIELGLESVILDNVQIEYKSEDMYSYVTSLKSEIELGIEGEEIEIDLKGDFTTNSFLFDNTQYLRNKPLNLEATIAIDSLGFGIQSELKLAQIPLDLRLTNNANETQVKITTPQVGLASLFDLIPNKYLSSIKGYTINGQTKLDISITSDHLSMPKLIVDFNYNNGTVQGNDLAVELKDISLNGSYTNGKGRNNNTTKIEIKEINCLANNELVKGDATIIDIDNPKVNTHISTQLQLSEIASYGFNIPLKSLGGKAQISLAYDGYLGMKNSIEYDVSMAEKSATISVENLELHIDNENPTLSDGDLQMTITNNYLDIVSFKGLLEDKNDFKFIGSVDNVFSYFLLKNAPLKLVGNLTSKSLNVDDFMLENDTSSQIDSSPMEAIQLPSDIIANVNLNIEDVTYDRLHLRNLASQINYKDNTFRAKNTELETMSGKITSDIRLKQLRSGKLRLISSTALDNINVRQLFYEFRNFGQQTMRHKHLKGVIKSEIYLRNEWDKFFNPIDDMLYSFIDVTITDGELLEFEPMMLMSDYISVEELKRIKFSTLENQVEIKNNSIEVPFMEINSSATDIACAGTYSFDGKMDFDIKVLLNEILGNKFRRKNKKKVSEFEIIEESNSKGMALFLKMEGTADEPIVSPNTFKLKESLNKEFKKEKRKLKDVIKNEFDNKENKQEIDNPDYNKIVEWEE